MTRDLFYDKATNKQFITIQGRGGSPFYIVIDYDAPVNEEEEQYTTYFLNQVDEADLAELFEESEPASCDCGTVCGWGCQHRLPGLCFPMTECAGKAPEPEKPQESNRRSQSRKNRRRKRGPEARLSF